MPRLRAITLWGAIEKKNNVTVDKNINATTNNIIPSFQISFSLS